MAQGKRPGRYDPVKNHKAKSRAIFAAMPKARVVPDKKRKAGLDKLLKHRKPGWKLDGGPEV